jgi:thiol-disulfide isomerase/thioredoxin
MHFATNLLLLLFACLLPPAQSASSRPTEKLEAHKGKIVVLNFWAAWCKPCRKEVPLLMELQRQYESRGVQVVGACTDDAKDRDKAEEFLRNNAVTYPVWFGLSDEDMKPLGLGSAIPATAIFDKEGKRVFRLIGEFKKKNLVERLEWLLGNQQGQPPKELHLPVGVDGKEYRER